MSTSRKQASKILVSGKTRTHAAAKILGTITPSEAKSLLVNWANLRDDDPESCLRLLKKHQDAFSDLLPITNKWLLSYRNHLRRAWDAPDRRHREWYVFQLRHALEHQVKIRASGEDVEALLRQGDADAQKRLQALLEPPPVVAPLEAALFYLQVNLMDRAKHCGGPTCPAPYFIAVKKWQRYCSEECVGPANRESKRQWWRENRAKNGGFD